MTLPNRTHSSTAYRYGFQGQEKDDEIKGEGNSINYTFRMHDPRVGRFFATDPLEKKYPMLTPYQFSGNRLIDSKEIEGMEGFQYTKYDIVNGQKIPIKQIVEVDVIVLVTTNSKDKISFSVGTGKKIEKILNDNFNPTEVYKDNRFNRTFNKDKIGKKKREYTTNIEGHTVPVEFVFNVSEQNYKGSETIAGRSDLLIKITNDNNKKTDFISTDGDIVRSTITVGQIKVTSIDDAGVASSGGNRIVFKKRQLSSIVHEIIHNFYSYDKNLIMKNDKDHENESIGGGGAMLYGTGAGSPPSQNNINFILKTVPSIDESEKPSKTNN
ncbi:RHS repeat-associated core domain-containing protein [Flavobacterium haoranii]|uniref:RHS repeat-associated core domain-containing protein n=2 Tax=Flavobacterium haoranii TaxID=683124 RepID=A0A1M6BAW1_9FLAO|nr:RHS repeat-associated core domain-containing protein [Flavobacterium haoranii]